MPTRLEPINLVDYTGGLNLRASQFQLADNESPDMLNVDIDPRGGFYTRKGWQRWNDEDAVDLAVETWKPRVAFVHNWANGEQEIYVGNNHKLYSAGSDGVFAQITGPVGDATPHQFDFSPWGDDIYIVAGMLRPSHRRRLDQTVVAMDPDNWSEVDAPVHDVMPQAEYIASHASYMFVAVTNEGGINHFARVRWSHPNAPDSWRTDDYLDIDSGGGRITGIMSFRDHLLIFKTNSMWALYGYDEDSWQLIKVSVSVGCPSITAASRSEAAVYFFSASDKGGIYAYTGDKPIHISDNLRPAFEEIIAFQNVFVSWANRRLWVGVPWVKTIGPTVDVSTCFVFDPDIGNGAWTMYRSSYGAVGPVLDGSDINARYPLSAFWSDQVAIMVTLDVTDDAYDVLLEPLTLGYTDVEGQAGYLTPTVGTVSTPDPGPLPNECCFVFKVRGPTSGSTGNQTIAGQWTSPWSWMLARNQTSGHPFWFVITDGTPGTLTSRETALPAPTGADEYLALSITADNGASQEILTARTSSDGVTWATTGTGPSGTPRVSFDTTVPLRIGASTDGNADAFNGRIYSVELRTGLDPAAGTVVWRFDASDYPGTGTSYVDPRGRTWTLTTAAAITPKKPPLAADASGWLMTSAGQEIELSGEGVIGQPFDAYYRTRWLHAGWPDRKKSWRRPTFICRQVERDTDLLVETFRDYNETQVHRTRTLKVRALGASYWTEAGFANAEGGGFDWKELGKQAPDGRGADWGAARSGANLIRSGSMGLARSVQMRVRASPLTPRQRWGVDGVVVKYVQRRFR